MLAKKLRGLDASSSEHQELQTRLDTVLYLTIDAVRMSGTLSLLSEFSWRLGVEIITRILIVVCCYVAILLQPAVPESTTKILDYLSVPQAQRSFAQATMMIQTSSSPMGETIDNSRSFVAFPKLLK